MELDYIQERTDEAAQFSLGQAGQLNIRVIQCNYPIAKYEIN